MHNWPLFQMDVCNAFLKGDLYEEVYMGIPEGFHKQGEYKASRQWNLKLTEVLVVGGYIQSRYDYLLFTKRQGNNIVILLVYVDDLLIFGNDIGTVNELKNVLHQNFKMKDLSDLKYFLDIGVAQSNKGIVLNQRKYTLELIEDVGLGEAKPANTPLEQNQKLTLFIHKPEKAHLEASLLVVRYIKKDPSQQILLSASGKSQLVVYYDSNWTTYPMSRSSIIGFCVKLRDSLIFWKLKKQSTVPCSSTEVEYRSMAAIVAKSVWLDALKEICLE
ncbi:protein detoxification 35 [Gossypium australe]|uniref:Protein detoxification 35 n=1 Tax=Gossypium australe TaxID=47621 RepID=A0A5B6VPH8_9ROSI|nr:protein detoxification 35 [Gossypium australe]